MKGQWGSETCKPSLGNWAQTRLEVCHQAMTSSNGNSDQALRNPQSYSTLFCHRKEFSFVKVTCRDKNAVFLGSEFFLFRESFILWQKVPLPEFISLLECDMFLQKFHNSGTLQIRWSFSSPPSPRYQPKERSKWILGPFWKTTLRCIRSQIHLWSQPQLQPQRKMLLRATSELAIFPQESASSPVLTLNKHTPRHTVNQADLISSSIPNIFSTEKSNPSNPQTNFLYPLFQGSQTDPLFQSQQQEFPKTQTWPWDSPP